VQEKPWQNESVQVDNWKRRDRTGERQNDARRSTRLSRQIAITITSLDPADDFRVECTTVVVNAHGCGVIIREQLFKDTLVIVKLVSNGRSKKGRVVLRAPNKTSTPAA
jgi:translation initiation factor IF-1